VTDVAALLEHAVTGRALRGQILEIGGPANLTFNQLAGVFQAATGRTGSPRHVPPPILRLMASTLGRVKPELGRQARAALIMDHADLTHDATGLRQSYPGLPSTSLSACLQR
jgi:NADH dehydrogenase